MQILPFLFRVNNIGCSFNLLLQGWCNRDQIKLFVRNPSTQSEDLNNILTNFFLGLMLMGTNMGIKSLLRDPKTYEGHFTFVCLCYFWSLTIIVVECSLNLFSHQLTLENVGSLIVVA